MSETSVAEGVENLSQEGEAPEAEVAATDYAAEATEYKNRFAGSQKKLTETLNALKSAQAERDALAQFKAQAERANMTELQALQADLEAARQEAATARAEAQREALARKFPQSAAVFGDKMPVDEDVLSALEKRLAAATGEESEPEPVIDPNHPRRTPTPTPEPDQLQAANDWLVGKFRGND